MLLSHFLTPIIHNLPHDQANQSFDDFENQRLKHEKQRILENAEKILY